MSNTILHSFDYLHRHANISNRPDFDKRIWSVVDERHTIESYLTYPDAWDLKESLMTDKPNVAIVPTGYFIQKI